MFQSRWRVLAIAGVMIARPAVSHADDTSNSLVQLHSGAVGLSVGGGHADGNSGLGGNAALTLDMPDLPVNVQASASTDGGQGGAPLQQKRSTKLDAHWTAAAPLDVAVSASEQTATTSFVQAPGTLVVSPQTLTSQNRAAGLALTIPVLPGVNIAAGAQASAADADDSARTAGAVTETRIQSATTETFASAQWQIAPGLVANAGVKDQGFAIGWSGAAQGGRRYDYVSPSAQVSVKPWPGATVQAGIDQSVTPYADGIYAVLANSSPLRASAPLAPDHAWRYQTAVTQSIGDAKFGASLTRSVSGTTTELAAATSGAVPVSTPRAQADQANFDAMLPLGTFGLGGLTLSADASLRDSAIKDPVTDAMRRASGEMPYQSHLTLAQDVSPALRIGIKGGLDGPVAVYQPSEVSTISGGADLGAFLAYKPGSFELDVAANGLAGARSANDNFYAGTRADSGIASSDRRDVSGPSVTIALKKAF